MDRWFSRTFELGLPINAAPSLIARLERTPTRLTDAVKLHQPLIRTHRPAGRWSVQEHAGHLLDLEPLWARRLDDFDRGAPMLQPADLDNRQTHEANHNARPLDSILDGFHAARADFVARLQAMTDAQLARVSKHPRLQQDMSVVDLCFFVAEHDDHHLATIEAIVRSLARIPE